MQQLTKKLRLLVALFLFFPLLSGCSSTMNVKDYQENQPKLSFFDYFQGDTRGWGIFQDRGDKLKRQFIVNIKGYTNEAGHLVLEEDFVWSDGEKSRRVWTITKGKNNQFTGKADDVVGEAQGETAGNALNWKYVLNLPVGDKSYKVKFDDWMFLQPDGVLLNRAKMSKFGFKIGEVIISFKKM